MTTGKSLIKVRQDLFGNYKKAVVEISSVSYVIHIMNLPTMFNFKNCIGKSEIKLFFQSYPAHYPQGNVVYLPRHIGQLLTQMRRI